MKIFHEVPNCLLETSLTFNDGDYCLVHLLDGNTKYRDFYKSSVEQGRHIILDNSIFELGESVASDMLVRWIKFLRPTEYIIPDALEDCEKTLSNFEAFKSTHGTDLPGHAMAVVQGKTYEEILHCVNVFQNDPFVSRIAISFDYSLYLTLTENEADAESAHLFAVQMGIPLYLVANKWGRYALGRLYILHKLSKDTTLRKKIHLLGCAVPWEVKYFNKLKLNHVLESIDTSNPIVSGILGKKYNTEVGLRTKWSKRLVDFIDDELTFSQVALAWNNVQLFRKFSQNV